MWFHSLSHRNFPCRYSLSKVLILSILDTIFAAFNSSASVVAGNRAWDTVP